MRGLSPQNVARAELLERLVDDYDERCMKGHLDGLQPLALLEYLILNPAVDTGVSGPSS